MWATDFQTKALELMGLGNQNGIAEDTIMFGSVLGIPPFTLMIVFLAYGFPIIVAFGRIHRERFAIAVVTILLGWTYLGWVFALVWSFSYQESHWWRDDYGLWHERRRSDFNGWPRNYRREDE